MATKAFIRNHRTVRLEKMGFTLDESRGHPIFKRTLKTFVRGTHCAIHALPENDAQTRFTVEVWKWQDEGGKQGAALPGEYTLEQVGKLMAIIDDMQHG